MWSQPTVELSGRGSCAPVRCGLHAHLEQAGGRRQRAAVPQHDRPPIRDGARGWPAGAFQRLRGALLQTGTAHAADVRGLGAVESRDCPRWRLILVLAGSIVRPVIATAACDSLRASLRLLQWKGKRLHWVPAAEMGAHNERSEEHSLQVANSQLTAHRCASASDSCQPQLPPMSSAAAPPAPLPVPHPECTAARHAWIGQLENSAEWSECENRPWANEANRVATGCIGKDFVLHAPRVHMRFFWNERLSTLSGAVHFAPDAEGPPKGAHGASVALVFDEILAYPVWRSGLAAFTANLNLNLRRMVPLGSTQRFVAQLDRKEGRKIFVSGAITAADRQTTYADATGLWVENGALATIQNVDEKGATKATLQSKL